MSASAHASLKLLPEGSGHGTDIVALNPDRFVRMIVSFIRKYD